MKFLFALILTAVTWSFFAPAAFAHVTENDNGLSVMIHINPNDEPVARDKDGSIYFEFHDLSNKFTGQDCDCTYSVSSDGKELQAGKLFDKKQSDQTAFIVPYIFPKKGLYQITANGKPKGSASFKEFSVTYDVRVEREDLSQPEVPESSSLISSNVLSYISLGIVALALLVILQQARAPKKKRKA